MRRLMEIASGLNRDDAPMLENPLIRQKLGRIVVEVEGFVPRVAGHAVTIWNDHTKDVDTPRRSVLAIGLVSLGVLSVLLRGS